MLCRAGFGVEGLELRGLSEEGGCFEGPQILGGCEKYGPFLDPYYNTAPNTWGTQKRDHNSDNHPFGVLKVCGKP